MAIANVNPASGEKQGSFETISSSEIRQRIDLAAKAQAGWATVPVSHRARRLEDLAAVLRANARGLAGIITKEMGKPISQSVSEIEKCAWVCEYYAAEGTAFLEPRHIKTDYTQSYVTFEPQGLVLGIMPWNFPFWQVFRAAIPTLLAGNGFVLKHASNVPRCALEIEKLAAEAGLPEHLLVTLLCRKDGVAEAMKHPRVTGVTLTGSSDAGRSVAAEAAKHLKKTVMELGGSDAYLILEDADLTLAATACVTGRMNNAGQSCIAPKRIIVVDAIRDEFVIRIRDLLKKYQPGDPMEGDTLLGPMAREDLRDELHEQVTKSVEQGAQLLLGGKMPDQKGAWYPATLLAGVKPGMVAFDEELFGPVVSIVPARDEAEAVALANNSRFGLGAAVFTSDLDRGNRLAREQLQAGCCFVNDFVKSDPRLPFGGIRESGYGRELSSFGIHEFVNIKTVVLK